MKHFLTLFFIYALCGVLYGQTPPKYYKPQSQLTEVNTQANVNAPGINTSKVKFGLIAGANYSNMNFNKGNPAPASPVSAAWKSGVLAGGFVQIHLAGKFFLKQEYVLSRRRGKDMRTETSYQMHYLSLPVLLKYSLLPRWSIVAGPQFELLARARTFTEGHSFNSTHYTEERSIGIVAGLEYQLTKKVSINSRFMHGFNHIGLGARPYVNEFKYESVQLSASYFFK